MSCTWIKLNNDKGYAIKYAHRYNELSSCKTHYYWRGGAIFTNNGELNSLFKSLRSHGVHKSPDILNKRGKWYHEFRELSSNYRLTDFQAALGLSQIKRLNSFKKRLIAEIYNKKFQNDEDLLFKSE